VGSPSIAAFRSNWKGHVMSIANPGFRNRYRRSGKVSCTRLLPWTLVTLAVSLLMAVCLYLVFVGGWYFYIVVPGVAALPVAGAAYLAVGGAHCRNGVVAGLFGLLAAAVLYLGYFHVHFVAEVGPIVGPSAIYRLDLLPRFILFRMQTDVVVDEAGKEQAAQGPWMNWVFFLVDFLVVIALVVGAAVARSGRVYCERCQRWTRRLMTHLPPWTAEAVQQALESGRLADLPEVPPPKGVLPAPCASFTVEYCRRAGSQASCPVYLTAKQLTKRQGAKVILNQVEVTAEELRGLAEKIPSLAPAEAGARRSAAAAPSLSDAVAQPVSPFVEALPPEWGDAVLSKRNKFLAGAASLIPIVLAGAGMAMIGWGLWRQPWAIGPGEGFPLLDWLLVAGGALAAGFGVVVCWNNVDFFNFRLGYRIARQAIQWRPSALVNPDDPQATYVDVVPREQWSDILSDRPSDVGFLKVDTAARQLLFEGVRQRYRIPGEALASCEVEPINAAAGRFTTYVTVIRTRHPHATHEADATDAGVPPWEAPLLPRPVRFGKYGPVQKRGLPEELRDRIRQIMPADRDSLS
jgi:hypothetical protein